MNIVLLFILSGIITGKVYNIDSWEPLLAHVYLESLDQIFLCDSSGNFILHRIPTGLQNLHISHIGFKEETVQVYVSAIDTSYLSIGLIPIPYIIPPLDVEAQRIPTIGTQTIELDEIQTIPGAERDLFKVIQILPGVSSASDLLGLFFVRGGDLYENQVLFDNMEILAPYHYFGIGSAFNINLVKNFEFYTGTFPARYGNAISSLLNIHSKEFGNTISGALSVDLTEADFLYSCPVNRNVSLVFSSKRNYLDLLLEKLGIEESVVLPYYADHQGKISIASPLGNFIIGGLRSEEGVNITASFAEERISLEMNGSGNSISTGWSKEFSRNITGKANLFYTNMHRYIYGEIPTAEGYSETAEEEVSAQKYGGTLHAEYTTDIIRIEAGGGIGRYTFMHTGPKVEDVLYKIGALNYSLEVDTADNYTYVYSSQRLALLTPFILEIGERADWFPLIEDPVFSPRIRLIYESIPTVYLAYGHQHQLPPLEYDVEHISSAYAKSISFGLEYLLRPALLAKIELYRKNYSNLIRKFGEEDFTNDGDGCASGIELSLRRYKIGDTFGWVSYAYSSSRKASPYDSEPVISDVHRPHIFNIFLGRHFKFGVEISVKWQVATGLAYRPVIGTEYDPRNMEWDPVRAPEKARLPFYHRLDVHLEKEFSLLGFNGEFYITVLNITDHRNVQGYLYNASYTQRKAFYMFPRVPFVGIKLTF